MTSAHALPPGVLSLEVLPRHRHGYAWDSILGQDAVKERLLGQALVSLLHGPRLRATPLRPHGLILLAGAPGTGKSTLALGLAEAAADAVATHGATTVVRLDPHAFPSDLLGESQRNITGFLVQTLGVLSAERPHTIVLLDEVEAMATSRQAAAFATNPVDVHRATDAVLAGIDHVAHAMSGVLIVATTNFPSAVDGAFVSRADAVIDVDVPDDPTARAIVVDSLRYLADCWPRLTVLVADTDLHERVAKHVSGWDGRRIRKAVASSIARRPDVARDPSQLTAADVESGIRDQLSEPAGTWR